MLAVLLTLLVVIFEPFVSETNNWLNSFFLLLLSTWLVGAAGVNLSTFVDSKMISFFYRLCAAAATFPIFFLVILLLRWFSKRKVQFEGSFENGDMTCSLSKK